MENKKNLKKAPGSFRDGDGYVFYKNGHVFRKINKSGISDYLSLLNSGLFDELVSSGKLIHHTDVTNNFDLDISDGIVIKPEELSFISYPYEWCFDQLRDAAIITLDVLEAALGKGMILKDGTPFNVQFKDGNPIFIDTLSFTEWKDGAPWSGYRQFCEQFLAPLLLMSYCDERLYKLSSVFLEGVPLDIVSNLLPKKTWLNPWILIHIHIHSKLQAVANKKKKKIIKISLKAMLFNIRTLRSVVEKLSVNFDTTWADYTVNNNYNTDSGESKKKIIRDVISNVSPKVVWDIGGNTGEYSFIASETGANIVTLDFDPRTIANLYNKVKKYRISNIYPVVCDITNPSGDIGWANEERVNIQKRKKPDCILALALIHHLVISKNIPFDKVASYFSSLTQTLIIEFVSEEDSQIVKISKSIKELGRVYSEVVFIQEFSKYFSCYDVYQVHGALRKVYVFRKL